MRRSDRRIGAVVQKVPVQDRNSERRGRALVDDRALEAGFDLACRAATVVGRGVSVVGLLVADLDPVAAGFRDATLGGNRAQPAGLDLALAAAAVAAELIAVVAVFAARDHAVTAHDRGNAGLARSRTGVV